MCPLFCVYDEIVCGLQNVDVVKPHLTLAFSKLEVSHAHTIIHMCLDTNTY